MSQETPENVTLEKETEEGIKETSFQSPRVSNPEIDHLKKKKKKKKNAKEEAGKEEVEE
jgi:fructose-1-phosphate kinase PfkB-like protein